MPLELELRQAHTIPLEVDDVRMEAVRELSPDRVRALPVQYGNKRLTVGEFFDVRGSAADDATVVWTGDCSRVKLIGARLAQGRMIVRGDCGMHVGAEMTGGEITVTGNAGDWAGAEMHGGRLQILGHAGHLVGAAYRGARRGMTGGEILVHGHAGNEVGQTMRRGLIAVGGSVGDATGVGLIAGTVLCFGPSGIRHGAGMRRGTIAFLGEAPPPPLLPTFKWSGTFRPVFLQIYLRYLHQAGFPVPADCSRVRVHRWSGDLLEIGKGEILLREP